MGGADRWRLAAVDAATGTVGAWNPVADPAQGNDVQALAGAGGALFAGGGFRQVGAAMQQGFASFGAAAAGAPAAVTCTAPGPAGTGSSSSSSGSSSSSHTTTSKSTARPTTTPAPAPAPAAAPPPATMAIAGFDLDPARFRAAPAAIRRRHPNRHYGTTFRVDLARAGSVEIVLERELFGRRRGGRCVPASASRRGARCTRYQRYGTLTRQAPAGPSAIPFTGRVSRGWLPAGVYTAKLTASDGTQTVSKLARFQVLAP
jgi:hypothetical protein